MSQCWWNICTRISDDWTELVENERTEISLCSSLLTQTNTVNSEVEGLNRFHENWLETDGILNMIWEVGYVPQSMFYLISASHFLPFEAFDFLHYWLWLRWHKRRFSSSLLCLMMRRALQLSAAPSLLRGRDINSLSWSHAGFKGRKIYVLCKFCCSLICISVSEGLVLIQLVAVLSGRGVHYFRLG